jgi:hypothetical protein
MAAGNEPRKHVLPRSSINARGNTEQQADQSAIETSGRKTLASKIHSCGGWEEVTNELGGLRGCACA